jgi:hypothetical protein
VEEARWSTDPLAADSDADGVSDGAEVALGRNPAVGGARVDGSGWVGLRLFTPLE